MKKIIKKQKKNKFLDYLLGHYNNFIDVFKKLRLNFAYVVVYDVLFYLASFFAVFIWGGFLRKEALKLKDLPMQGMMQLNKAQADQVLASLKGFIAAAIISFVILIIFIIINWSFFKGLIWATIAKKKFSLKYFGKFTLLNFLWMTGWLILSLPILFPLFNAIRAAGGAVTSIPPAIRLWGTVLLVLILIVSYLTAILYAEFVEENRIWGSIVRAFKIGIGRFYLLLAPYIIAIAMFLAVSLALWPGKYLPPTIYSIIVGIVLIAYFSWLKFYLFSVIDKIKVR